MKRWLLVALKAIVSASLLVYLFSKVNLGQIEATLERVSFAYLFVAALILLVQMMLGAVRWGLVIDAIASPVRLLAVLRVAFIGLFFNQVLPSAIGGDAMRIWCIRQYGPDTRTAVSSVLLDRLVALLALGMFMLITYPVLQQLVTNRLLRLAVMIAALGVIGGLVLFYHLRHIPRRLFSGRVVEEIRLVSAAAHKLTRVRTRSLQTIALSLIMHSMIGMAVYAVARGLGLSIGLLPCVVLTPPISLITVLPISVAGWGVREAGMVTALGFAGVPAHDALIVSVLLGILPVVIGIPGGLFWLYTSHPPRPARAH